MNLPQLKAHPECKCCELNIEATNTGIPTTHYTESLFPSPDNPYIFIIGMSPGYHEDKENKPFVGPTGVMLKSAYLKSLDILKSHTIYLTNAARCSTPGDTQLKNSHIKSCWHHTDEDLKEVTNFHNSTGSILCLGTHAVQIISKNYLGKSMSLKKSIEMQGTAIKVHDKQLNFFCTYHPAGVMRSPNLKYAVSEHLELIGQQLKGNVPSPSLPIIIPLRSPRQGTVV